jgi:hypothetical protein
VEHDHPELSWFTGAGVGAALVFPVRGVGLQRLGLHFELSYRRRSGAVRAEYQPHDPALPAVVERYSYVAGDVSLTLGGLVEF